MPLRRFGSEATHIESSVIGYEAVSESGEKIGKIEDYVTNETGDLRFFIVDTGFWIFGKKVLVPVGRLDIDDENRQVVLHHLTKQQVEAMPAYKGDESLQQVGEEQWLGAYPKESEAQRPFFEGPERIRLMEEQLRVNKHREKVADVHVTKEVTTHTEHLEVPVTEERVVIERHSVGEIDASTGRRVGETERIEIPIYEERVEVTKQPVVREEVEVHKETVTHQERIDETVQREELRVDHPENVREERRNP